MNVCMYVQNERVCHGVSYRFWAKMWHPEDPPPRLLEAQKNTWGGYISRGQVKYFSEISCLTPPKKNPGLKVGGCNYLVQYNNMYVSPVIIGAYCIPSGPRKAMGFSHAWYTLGYPKWYSLVNELTKNYVPNHHV